MVVQAQVSGGDIAAVDFLVDGVVVARVTTPSEPGIVRSGDSDAGSPDSGGRARRRSAGNVESSERSDRIGGLRGRCANHHDHVAGHRDKSPFQIMSSPSRCRHPMMSALPRIRVAAFGIGTLQETREFPAQPKLANATFDVPIPEGVGAGSLTFSAIAIDTAGQASATATVTVTISVDTRPTVDLTAPAEGSAFVEGSEILATANADDDVAVAQVEFLIEGALFKDTSAPYEASATLRLCPGGGTATISAAAVDTHGQRSDVDSVQINCTDDLPPSLAITAPAPATDFREGDSMVLSATADDDFGVSFVTFEVQGQSLYGRRGTLRSESRRRNLPRRSCDHCSGVRGGFAWPAHAGIDDRQLPHGRCQTDRHADRSGRG